MTRRRENCSKEMSLKGMRERNECKKTQVGLMEDRGRENKKEGGRALVVSGGSVVKNELVVALSSSVLSVTLGMVPCLTEAINTNQSARGPIEAEPLGSRCK